MVSTFEAVLAFSWPPMCNMPLAAHCMQCTRLHPDTVCSSAQDKCSGTGPPQSALLICNITSEVVLHLLG